MVFYFYLILKYRYVTLGSVDNRNGCKKWLVDLAIVSVWVKVSDTPGAGNPHF